MQLSKRANRETWRAGLLPMRGALRFLGHTGGGTKREVARRLRRLRPALDHCARRIFKCDLDWHQICRVLGDKEARLVIELGWLASR